MEETTVFKLRHKLPDRLRVLFVRNLIKQKRMRMQIFKELPTEALIHSIHWDSTPEGGMFWAIVVRLSRRHRNVPDMEPGESPKEYSERALQML